MYRRLARATALMALVACVCAATLPGGLVSRRGPVRVVDTQTGGVVFEGAGAEAFVQALLATNDGYVSTQEQTAMSAAPAESRAQVEGQPLLAALPAGSAGQVGWVVTHEFPEFVPAAAQWYEGWRRGRGS